MLLGWGGWAVGGYIKCKQTRRVLDEGKQTRRVLDKGKQTRRVLGGDKQTRRAGQVASRDQGARTSTEVGAEFEIVKVRCGHVAQMQY